MALRPSAVEEPVLPGPEPIRPGPDPIPPNPEPNPGPDPPLPPPLPDPAPEPSDPDGLMLGAARSDVVVELRGSIAFVSGVVESAHERARIIEEIGSLDTVTRVESALRPPAA